MSSEKKATTKFEQDFFKQLINSAFGKFRESKRNRLIVDIVRNAEELQNLSNKKRFSSIKIIDQHLVSVTSKPVNIKWDKPTIVGATILVQRFGKILHVPVPLQHNQVYGIISSSKFLFLFFYHFAITILEKGNKKIIRLCSEGWGRGKGGIYVEKGKNC